MIKQQIERVADDLDGYSANWQERWQELQDTPQPDEDAARAVAIDQAYAAGMAAAYASAARSVRHLVHYL